MPVRPIQFLDLDVGHDSRSSIQIVPDDWNLERLANKAVPAVTPHEKLAVTDSRDGRLRPGELLRDQDIAATVGVSRTPVREALRRLEDEGLVETALNRWTRVAPIDIGKAAEIYAIVEALELFALETAIKRLTAQDVTRMREANQAMRRAAELQDPATAVIADESFHEV